MPAILMPVESGKPIVLDKPIVLVGRHPDCDAVILNSRKISRKHCAVALVNNNFVVRDLGSMNGVWVNGDRVEQQAPVGFGDELMIGDVRFRLEADKPSAGKSSKPAEKAPAPVAADVKSPRKKPFVTPPQSELSLEFPVPIDDDDDGFAVPAPANRAASVGASTDGDGEDFIPLKTDKPAANKSKKPVIAEAKPAPKKAMVIPPQSELSMEFPVPVDDDDDVVASLPANKASDADREELIRLEAAKQEAARQEAARLEEARQEAAKQEAARLEAARLEEARQEAARIEEARQEAARIEAAREEAARKEAARQELARLEAAKLEVARLEAARLEAARQEAVRQEAARQEAAKQEAARQEAARQEAARLEVAKLEAAKLEVARLEAAKLELARLEAEKREAEKREAEKREAEKAAVPARPEGSFTFVEGDEFIPL